MSQTLKTMTHKSIEKRRIFRTPVRNMRKSSIDIKQIGNNKNLFTQTINPQLSHTQSLAKLGNFEKSQNQKNRKQQPSKHGIKLLNSSYSVDKFRRSILESTFQEFENSQQSSFLLDEMGPSRASGNNDGLMLEAKLNQKLSNIDTNDKNKQFQVIQEYFGYVIEQLDQYSGVLKIIKTGYESYITQREDLLRQKSENEKKLARSLARQKDKVKQIIAHQHMQRDEDNISASTSSTQEQLSQLEKSLRRYKQREKVMGRFISVMKKQGIPVDDIFENQVRRSQKSQPEKPPLEQRPQIPKLNFQSTSAGSFLTSEGSIPMLKIPPKSSDSFQDEFLAKADEFSESWRKQLESDEKKFIR